MIDSYRFFRHIQDPDLADTISFAHHNYKDNLVGNVPYYL